MDWKDGLTVERRAVILIKKMASDADGFMRTGTRESSILAGDDNHPPRPDTLAQTEKPERKSLAVGASHTFFKRRTRQAESRHKIANSRNEVTLGDSDLDWIVFSEGFTKIASE